MRELRLLRDEEQASELWYSMEEEGGIWNAAGRGTIFTDGDVIAV